MKIKIVAAGRLKNTALQQLIDDYFKRCQWKIEIIEVEQKNSKDETSRFLSFMDGSNPVIILDEKGITLSSEKFAKNIQQYQNDQISSLTFIIGGAYGLDQIIRAKADLVMSFGKQTWPHMMVRLMLIEQIYRAEQIIKGHPYHKY